jgi:hypothetical protein
MEAIAAAMHRMSQLRLPIAVVGTGLPQLPGLMVEAKSYAERLFSYPQVGPLSEQAAREALLKPAEEEGVEFDAGALAQIVEISGGYPTFIQAYGKEAWNMAPGPTISSDDVEASAPIVQTKLDEEFSHVRFEKATPRERVYMAAMADLGDGPIAAATSRSAWPTINSLLTTRRAHQEGPDLQPRPRSGRLHRAALLAVHAPPLPAGSGRRRRHGGRIRALSAPSGCTIRGSSPT